MTGAARMKAWRVSVPAWPGVEVAIAAAPGRDAARFAAWAAWREAGYDLGFGAFRVVRAPEHDGWAAGAPRRTIVIERYLDQPCDETPWKAAVAP